MVHVSDWIDLIIDARASGDASEVAGRVSPTPNAALFLLLLILPALYVFFPFTSFAPEASLPFGLAETAIGLGLFLRGREFARRAVLSPTLAPRGRAAPGIRFPTQGGQGPPGQAGPGPAPSELGALLTSRLSQMHGLALEAHESLRAKPARALGLIIMVALAVVELVAFELFWFDPGRFGPQLLPLLGLGAAIPSVLALVAYAVLRRQYNRRSVPIRSIESRLWDAMVRESSGLPPGPGQGSVYELLAEASQASLLWLNVSVREFVLFKRSPRLLWLNLLNLLLAFGLFVVATWSFVFPNGLVSVIGAFVLLVLAATTVATSRATRRWQSERFKEEEERRAEWERRFRAFRDRADAYLRDL